MAPLNYRINEKAAEDIDRLFEYGIDNFGLKAAQSYIEGMERRFVELGLIRLESIQVP